MGPSGPCTTPEVSVLCLPGPITLVGVVSASSGVEIPLRENGKNSFDSIEIDHVVHGIISSPPPIIESIECPTQVDEVHVVSSIDEVDRTSPLHSDPQRSFLRSPRTRAQKQATQVEQSCKSKSIPLPQPSSPLSLTSTSTESHDLDVVELPVQSRNSRLGEPVKVHVEVISGEGQQCGYRAVAKSLGGDFTVEQVHALIVHTLDSIDDAPMLHSYGINVDPLGDTVEVQRAKEEFKNDSHFREMRQMGDTEWYLISHAMDGDISFLFVLR